jgi:hypothetical protein
MDLGDTIPMEISSVSCNSLRCRETFRITSFLNQDFFSLPCSHSFLSLRTSTAFDIEMDTVAWWYMSCGRALGMLNGNLIEYDSSTLAPLGLVVGADELVGKKIGVINSGLDADTCALMFDEEGMEGADCAALAGDLREQAVVLLDKKTNVVTVVQPNEDGSYWRKIVRNKMIRMKEVRRVKAAKLWASELLKLDDDSEAKVVSSWGPYTTTSGTAKKTSVPGLTAPSAL